MRSWAVGVREGVVVGEEDAVQLAEGEALGLALGLDVVLEVGVALGVLEGEALGLAEGVPLGLAVGVWVGVAVGVDVALAEWVAVGLALGVALGLAVGVPEELAEAGPPLRQERDAHSYAQDAQTRVRKRGGCDSTGDGGGIGRAGGEGALLRTFRFASNDAYRVPCTPSMGWGPANGISRHAGEGVTPHSQGRAIHCMPAPVDSNEDAIHAPLHATMDTGT